MKLPVPILAVLLLLVAVSARDGNKKTHPEPPSQSASVTPLPGASSSSDAEAGEAIKADQSEDGKPSASRSNLLKRLMSQRKSPNFEEASASFGEFLESGDYVGKPLSEIKAAFGKPDAEAADAISYRFDGGFGGWDWVFSHDGEKIVGFTPVGVN